MTAARHIVALLRSHIDGDDAQFLSVAMQAAAQEARQGHGKLAQELRDLVDKARSEKPNARSRAPAPIPLVQPKGELSGLVEVRYSDIRLSSMVLPSDTEGRLRRVLTEQRQRDRLRAAGLSPRRKLLLIGPPGAGKTMTAAAIAGEMHQPLFTALLDGLITKFMGETASKLRLVFEAMVETRGVYFFKSSMRLVPVAANAMMLAKSAVSSIHSFSFWRMTTATASSLLLQTILNCSILRSIAVSMT